MKHFYLYILLLLINLSHIQAQTVTQRDLVAITPLVSEELNMASGVKTILETKARQMLTSNGLASYSERFILTPNITVLTKEVTATAPVMFSMDLEISFYVLDVVEETILHEISFPAKAVANQEHKAYIQAINKINVKSPEVRYFIEEAKNRIHDYYKARIPTLVKKAETLCAQGLYQDALVMLSGVPEAIEGYDVVAKGLSSAYKQWVNYDADRLLSEAKSLMAIKDMVGAMELLAQVDPLSDRYKNANALVNQLVGEANARERAAMEMQMKIYEDKKETAQREHDDKVALTKMAINAGRDVAVAYMENNKSTLMKSVNKWFKSKFQKI